MEKPAGIKGHRFEQEVALWVKEKLKADLVETNILVSGLSVRRPYEVDVYVRKKRSFPLVPMDIWVECKDRQSSIKRKDIANLVSKAEDVFQAYKAGRERFYFDRLALVSTSKFDFDALAYADQTDVLCIYANRDEQKYEEKNNPDWESDPNWLRRPFIFREKQ